MDALDHFENYLNSQGVRYSKKRMQVFGVFVACEKHLSVNELVALVHKKFPKIGIATVYRTIKLICDAGIARAVEFGDGTVRYEHDYGHDHHDHLVCTTCGAVREINNERIEHEQQKIAEAQGFLLQKHKMVLYGVCGACVRKNGHGLKTAG